jgi:hypothetical protein
VAGFEDVVLLDSGSLHGVPAYDKLGHAVEFFLLGRRLKSGAGRTAPVKLLPSRDVQNYV